MALDLGLTTHQLLSTLDGVVNDAATRAHRLDDAVDRALNVADDEAAFRTAAVGRRPYISARTGPEGLLGSRPPPEVPQDWVALSVDGSHIDVDRHLPLRCHLINLGGCIITYGKDFDCHLFSEPALTHLRAASTDRRPVAVAAYTSRPRTTEAAGAVRLMLCDQGDADCNRLCTARHSQSETCDGAAGFDDRELFELLLEPGHRSPLYRSSHLAARFALGLATGQEWSHFYYLNGGGEIARVEVPDWLAGDPELLALSHAMLVKQCELGLGYPVAISEAHEQAVITGHDREEFRRMTLMLLEQRGLSTSESAKAFSKRRPWV